MSPNTCTSEIVRIQLTAQQAEQLAPLVQRAAADGENVVFIATVAPVWQQGVTIWELQTIVIPARIGHRIRRLVLSESAVTEEVAH